jgi:hypothetical protein
MPTLTIEYSTESERLALERAIAFVTEMQHVAGAAAYGTVLDACETHALQAGRALLRDTLESAVQSQIDAQKKKPGRVRKATAPAAS